MSDRLKPTANSRTKQTNATLDKWSRLKAQASGSMPSWAWAGAEDLQAAVVAATEDGVALLFAKTSDGGALVLHVLTGLDPIKIYPSDASEINEALQQVVDIAGGPK